MDVLANTFCRISRAKTSICVFHLSQPVQWHFMSCSVLTDVTTSLRHSWCQWRFSIWRNQSLQYECHSITDMCLRESALLWTKNSSFIKTQAWNKAGEHFQFMTNYKYFEQIDAGKTKVYVFLEEYYNSVLNIVMLSLSLNRNIKTKFTWVYIVLFNIIVFTWLTFKNHVSYI